MKISTLLIFIIIVLVALNASSSIAVKEDAPPPAEEGDADGCRRWPLLVKKGERKTTVSTEDGEISAVRISDGASEGWYHIEFITLEPNSLFLPVLLQAHMVFYVHTGSGQISWTDEDETKQLEVKRGDIYRLRPGTLFYIQSSLEMERKKLRIYALFANAENDLHEPATGPYSSIRKLVLGFDKDVLQAAFGVSGEEIEEMASGPDPGAIVHGLSREKKNRDMELEFFKGLLGSSSIFQSQSNKKKKLYNIFSNDPDFENCNGWSTVVSKKESSALKGIDVSLFMVNLTKGSMMGPHWNPKASEIGICLHGSGMIRIVCPSNAEQTDCKNMRFFVEEGDVFAVPRFHPMAQMAFNNDSFVFMGFSTSAKSNHPQYLAGKASVLLTLNTDVVASSFSATNTTMDQVLNKQKEAIILECTSCAEEELRMLKEEIEKAKEEARKREEEEARKKEEEEREKQKEKEREEEAKKREEERKKQQEEEARKKEEEQARKEEEEREKQKEKEREEEEAKKREEEEEREKQEEKREEEEARKREEQAREEEEREKQQEEEKARKEEEEREKQQEKEREEEEAKKREEEEEREKQEKREEEEEARKREEQAREEEERRKQQEAAAARREEARKREEQTAAARREEAKKREEEEEGGRGEERAARSEEEAMEREARKRAEEEETHRQHEGPGQEWGRRILKIPLKA